MSTIHRIHRSHRLVVGSALVLACTLLVPVVGSAQEEEGAVPAPLAAPAAVGTSAASVRAVAQAVAAQAALQSGGIGSMQEDRLRAIVAAAPAAGPSWDETSGYGAVEASRAETLAHGVPPTGTTGEAAPLAQFGAVELAHSRYLEAEK